jgi:hypothetical protein
MLTPTLKTLADHYGEPVPVFFSLDHVKSLFLKCPFIKIIDEPEGNRLFGSDMINQNIPDYEYVFFTVTRNLGIDIWDIPHTYVDSYQNPFPEEDYVVMMAGCGVIEDKWFDMKIVNEKHYHEIMQSIPKDYKIYIIGTERDKELFWKNIDQAPRDVEFILDDMTKSLGLIKHCRFMITNDTGMYHAAGALDIPAFVMWKNTNFEKNKSPGHNLTFSFHEEKWVADFQSFIEETL